MEFLKKLKIEQLHDPAIPLLSIYLEKTIVPKDTWTPVFTAALLALARRGITPQYPLVKVDKEDVVRIYHPEYYSALYRGAEEMDLRS